MYIKDRSVTEKYYFHQTFSLRDFKMKKWNLHTSPTKKYIDKKDFILTKSDKQYVCVVMYFNNLQKHKLPTAHYYFYLQKYFDKY